MKEKRREETEEESDKRETREKKEIEGFFLGLGEEKRRKQTMGFL